MKKRIVIGALALALLAGGPAQAKSSHRIIYSSVLAVVGTLVAGMLTTGIALHYSAPNADTLQNYKREDGASSGLIVAGCVLAVPTTMFAIVGAAILDLSKEPAVSLAPSSSGVGLVLGGRF